MSEFVAPSVVVELAIECKLKDLHLLIDIVQIVFRHARLIFQLRRVSCKLDRVAPLQHPQRRLNTLHRVEIANRGPSMSIILFFGVKVG